MKFLALASPSHTEDPDEGWTLSLEPLHLLGSCLWEQNLFGLPADVVLFKSLYLFLSFFLSVLCIYYLFLNFFNLFSFRAALAALWSFAG